MADQLLLLIVAFFASWQVKVLAGLILIDIALGVAAALRRGEFDWHKLADFYRTMILPYILGYLAFYLAVEYIIPTDSLGSAGNIINQATITLAWMTLVSTLVASIQANFSLLYATQD
jgi:hypothetical protein